MSHVVCLFFFLGGGIFWYASNSGLNDMNGSLSGDCAFCHSTFRAVYLTLLL